MQAGFAHGRRGGNSGQKTNGAASPVGASCWIHAAGRAACDVVALRVADLALGGGVTSSIGGDW